MGAVFFYLPTYQPEGLPGGHSMEPNLGEIKQFELYGLFEGFALHCIVWGGNLGGGFKTFFFLPLFEETIQFGEQTYF